MLRTALVLVFTTTACVTDGNRLTGRWTSTNCDDGLYATGVTVVVAGADGSSTSEHARCGDGGFAIIVPTSVTAATITVTDGIGASWSSQLAITNDMDLGTIYFDRGTSQD